MVILTTFLILGLIIQIIRLIYLTSKEKKSKQSLYKRQKELYYIRYFTTSFLFEKQAIRDFFPKYLNHMKEIFNWTYHSIFKLDEEKQVLIIRFTGYLPDWYMSAFSSKIFVKVGDVAVGRSVITKQPVIINDIALDIRTESVLAIIKKAGYSSLSAYPLLGRIKTYGSFTTYSAQKNIFTYHDSLFFTICSNLFGAILEYNLLIPKYKVTS